jgi:hypothetical protein
LKGSPHPAFYPILRQGVRVRGRISNGKFSHDESVNATDVQIFTPTPEILSIGMYYAECNLSFKAIPVEKKGAELLEQEKFLTS